MSHTQDWNATINHLKGVGPKTATLFQSIGIYTIRDLMFHFPFRFEDLQARELNSLLDQEKVALVGKVITDPTVSYFGRKKSRLSFKMAVDSYHIIQVTFFNQPYLKKHIQAGQMRAIYGKWQEASQQLMGTKLINQTAGEDFSPIYRSTQSLKQGQIVKAIHQAFEDYSASIEEIIPNYLNQRFHLIPLQQALKAMHFPSNSEEQEAAKKKIIFQDFFLYQWKLQSARYQRQHLRGQKIDYPVDELRQAIKIIPFELTAAQKKAVNEICVDLLSTYPMKRLLQGDVGSGKTLVAFITMLAVVQAGFQTALMVPTEILAQQHYQSFNRYFEAVGFHAELLTSDMNRELKKTTIEGLASGRIRIVIGTHALIQDYVKFKNLAYIVIDEQHRFGVGQRQELLEKANANHLANILQMTATPIPRSLAQTLYADMSVSTIDELPGGRQAISTVAVKEDEIDHVYDRIEKEISLGHQVYYVLPLIEASEYLGEVENVQNIVSVLSKKFPAVQVAPLHGQMNKEEQKIVMEQFKEQQIQILVATTMVEVGVDVPNATVMVIQSAERFGLAQLHQLRGRVGRSHLASYCFLIANPTTQQGKERIEQMVKSQNGFDLSEADLKIRGMGDLLGRSQSGIPMFQVGNPLEFPEIMQAAYQAVQEIFTQKNIITNEERQKLIEYAEKQPIEV
ncbi:ATP-dependent DNA helicase RecG [Facklamia sp. DSM 111018]|uniref:ATP-dependent DNA helicase RecG n=1 Tax=Facklamia lactis TaxID=2749967 RepID=A0ABS0LPT7_9LACT|nr:ATP-dependent DNA helicase RecG [Facklamia lactis]MBG9979805.1 ATP-dependent DNA helicase RecG [Facklamia lactis]MBG9985515.1 ATP-dependent DNA helicase RecG [Facklamia lactis]